MRSANSTAMSAVTIAKNRERNRAWCAQHRGVRNRSAWLLGAPPFPTHLPGGGFELHIEPAPKRAIDLRHTRGMHGLVTAMIGEPHHPTIPGFALVPWPRGCGWGVWSQLPEAAALAGRAHAGTLWDVPALVRCGPLVRVRAPVVQRRGRRRMRLDSITPVLVRADERAMHTHPTAANLGSTLCAWLPRRVGLHVSNDDAPIEIVSAETQPATVYTGGKFGASRGWVGHVVVETNAVGHWLLELGARIGIGGRVALGFGRVRVSEVG